jgi:hypothetical protein
LGDAGKSNTKISIGKLRKPYKINISNPPKIEEKKVPNKIKKVQGFMLIF